MSFYSFKGFERGNSRCYGSLDMFVRRAFLLGSATILPLCYAQSAQAQSCTPAVLTQSSSGFQGRDASGDPAGFDSTDLAIGDFVVYENAIVADYNPAAAIDFVIEITDLNLNSAMPPNSVSSNNLNLSNSGALTLSGSRSMSDPFVTYRLVSMRGGTVTSTVASGSPVSMRDARISLQDVDSITTQDTSDVAGYSNANPNSFTISLTDTVQLGFQNGGGPANFTTFTQTPITTSPVSWDGAVSGDFTDNTVDFTYPIFTQGEFLHGLTGFSTRSNNRGAVVAMCGEIAPSELTSSKTINSVSENSDGTTDVSYTISIENTGDQYLTDLSLTDDLDSVFSGPYDAFTPSTVADMGGGVIAQDLVATVVTDTGNPIGDLTINAAFNGGSDINLFDPASAIDLDPGDEITLTFTIKLNPNETGSDVTFANDITATMTDEFLLPTTSNTVSAPVNIPNIDPSLSMTKTANSAGPFTVGDVVIYTYRVTNDGNQIIRNVAVTDRHNGSDPAPVPGDEVLLMDAAPMGDSTDATSDGHWDVLAPGDTLTFTGSYTVTAADAGNL